MKANAPEKIYIPTILAANTVRYKAEGSIEYVRADAFIEKASKFIKDNGNFYIDIVNGQLVLKKDIIKDFKKYMKG